MSGILIWAETKEGKVRKPVFEAMAAARSIVGPDGDVHVVLIGESTAADELAGYPVSGIHTVQGDHLEQYQSESYCNAMHTAVKTLQTSIVINAATTLGRDLSARLAAKMDAVLATDVTAINCEPRFVVTRPVYSGKLLAQVELLKENKVITIRPNTFDAMEATAANSPVTALEPEAIEIRAQVQEAVAAAQDMLDVTEADIVITGGRGVGGADGFKIIEEIARSVGGAVGASRTAVDEGWIPYKHQVGQTGKVVTPVLYIACGVSGAIQHFAGMGSSRFIIAINTDAEAPIMKKADFAIVGDLFEVLPVLKEELVKVVN